jgi:thymidylate kinase
LIAAVKSKLNLKTRKLYLGMGENGWTSPLIKKIYNYKLRIRLFSKIFNFLKTYIILPSEFILRILRVKIRSKYSVVLIDRFPGTIFLDNRLGRRFIFKSILPKPDIVFFIYADPHVLIKRKPTEVTLERSKADIIKFQKVADIVSGGNYIGIDTSNMTIVETRDLIISEIYKSPKVYNNLFTAKLN